MGRPTREAIIILIVVLISSIGIGNAAVNDVAEEFNTLCILYQLASKGSEVSDKAYESEWAEVETELLAYNLSLAGDKFYETDFGRELVPDKEEQNYVTYAAKWKAIKEKISGGQPIRGNIKVTRAPQTTLAAAARTVLNETITEAKKLQVELTDGPAAKDIQAELSGAIYGKGQSAIDTAGKKTTGDNANEACGNAGSTPTTAGVSLINDMLCLCGIDSTAQGKQCGGTSLADVAFSGKGSATTEFAKLTPKCHSLATPDLSGSNLQQALQAWQRQLGRHAESADVARAIYGKPSAANACSGAANGGACVNYKNTVRNSKPDIAWLTALTKAAAQLGQKTQAREKAKETLLKLKTLVANARNAYLTAQTPLTPSSQSPGHNQAATGKQLQQTKADCAAHKDKKKDCEAAKCIWKGGDNEKGDCEVNTTQITEQAKQAEKDGATADPNCSQYTDPEKCFKAPGKPKEGKKSVCCWIDLIDGQEKNLNQNSVSIFLVNKKLVLMAASFVRLVSF
uniref:Variant surface glycoprotein 1125.471 n=1 Tax=Trypanosoma brucei TaxID=5691 RepID=A0A1J0R5Y2_9TRYP|nr:variant surface glycoprotein 1125.471 [Trypanosoma brucei]